MAVEIICRKLHHSLVPADQAQLELMEELKPNGEYKVTLTQPRILWFHRRAFALAKVGFEAWEPPEGREHKGRPILKSFDAFRDELTIRAGFYDVVWDLKGNMRLIPHSWSWGAADQEKFERMYSGFLDVILRDVLTNYTKDDLEEQVNRVLGFC